MLIYCPDLYNIFSLKLRNVVLIALVRQKKKSVGIYLLANRQILFIFYLIFEDFLSRHTRKLKNIPKDINGIELEI